MVTNNLVVAYVQYNYIEIWNGYQLEEGGTGFRNRIWISNLFWAFSLDLTTFFTPLFSWLLLSLQMIFTKTDFISLGQKEFVTSSMRCGTATVWTQESWMRSQRIWKKKPMKNFSWILSKLLLWQEKLFLSSFLVTIYFFLPVTIYFFLSGNHVFLSSW